MYPNKHFYLNIGIWLILVCLTACQAAPTIPAAPRVPAAAEGEGAAVGLNSLKKVDDYPLYTMTLVLPAGTSQKNQGGRYTTNVPQVPPGWGCSLFASFANPEGMLYGRNFDFDYSPALLLFTRPADGYASVSMVDLAYLGFSKEQLAALDELPLAERQPLLDAPRWPFDGMNSEGLVVGMAAVPVESDVPDDPNKPSLGSLEAIREILDHAASVDEAVKFLQGNNIIFRGGPPLHYLIADAHRQAALVEFFDGKVIVMKNEQNWLVATNFVVAETNDNPQGHCTRYDLLTKRLSDGEGFSTQDGLALLKSVSQDSTQWSVVYDYSRMTLRMTMGNKFDQTYSFQLVK